ncbi:fused response regulator/phosphatase [Candidatus Poribacteria bacterium]|nr:fused response regulator/phosphatase [Candidatus Poribacteria bacterium]
MAELILVVDDDIDILELLEMSLTSDGFNVVTASNGPSALEKTKAHKPDLILLDLMMPDMDGFEVISKLKADPQTRTIPVIMLTARTQSHEKIEGLSAGADDYITKPFELKELALRIGAILGRTRQIKYINPLIGAMGDWFSKEGVEQLASHLKMAAMIQQKLLPQGPPQFPGFDIAGFLRSSTTISGDFYDFIPLSSSRLGIAIADVRGKGIPAALLMVMIRTALRLVCREESKPSSVLKRINDLLAIDTEPDLFATMVYGILDAQELTFTYSNAGHCYPLHLKHLGTTSAGNIKTSNPNLRGGLEIDQLRVGGMVLGSFDFVEFEEDTIPLESDDTIFFYTDGVTEAERETDGTLYGEERLAEVLLSNGHLSAEMTCQAIETDLLNFSGKSQRNDDLTIVVIKVGDYE